MENLHQVTIIHMIDKNERKAFVDLGIKIRTLREKKGFKTIAPFAKRAGISSGGLCDIENGSRDPRLSGLMAIADALDMTLSDLLKDIK